MSHINEAFARLECGKARYRIVLDADFCSTHPRENIVTSHLATSSRNLALFYGGHFEARTGCYDSERRGLLSYERERK